MHKMKNSNITFLDIPVSLFASALSTLSLLIFHYFRNCEDAVSYYTTAGKNLILDALQVDYLWIYILVAVLLIMYNLMIRRKYRPRFLAPFLVSLPLAFNMIISLSMEHSDLREIFLPGEPGQDRILTNVVIFWGFACLLASVIALLYTLLDRRAVRQIDLNVQTDIQLERFLITYVLIFAGWLPTLLMCYPGSLDTDALGQIKGYMGVIRIDAANPILPTLLYGWIFKMGRIFGSNDRLSLFKIVMLQNVFNAGFMALVSIRSYQFTKSKFVYYATILFFSLTPMWQRASQHVLKDVLHVGWYLMFYISYLSCLEKDRVKVLDVCVLCFCCIMISFTRIAVFFIAVIAVAILLVTKKKVNAGKYAVCLAIVVSLYMGVEKIIYPMFDNIKPPREVENYSMQLQQVALYCREYGDDLSDEELQIINGTLDYKTIVQNYTPMISDPVKHTWHGTEEDHQKFWGLYRKLFSRHPLVFIKGIFMFSFEHFNPWYSGNRNGVSMAKDPEFHDIDYKFFDSLIKTVNYWNSWLDYPVSRVIYGNGLYAWILIIMTGYAIKHRSLRAILGLVPHIALMIGLFMSHVNGLLRYGYPLIAATPLISAYSYFAANRLRTLQADVPHEEVKVKHSRVKAEKNILKNVLDNTVQAEKNIIRKLCYSVLRRLDETEKDKFPKEK